MINLRGFVLLLLAALAPLCSPGFAAEAGKPQSIGVPWYTIESPHFRIHYMHGLEHVAREAGGHLEELYDIYRNQYNLRLPRKTDVLVTSDEYNYENFAFPNTNLLSLAANDFEFNLRGSGNYFRDVIAHEYAHVVSMWTSIKIPRWMPYMQFGSFSHVNESRRTEALHVFPSEILPPWFSEGIAQYESTLNGGDRWDSHRDMIMRTLTLSGSILSWDHMQAFSGRGDDFEKTYNHGFSLVTYIANTYGYGTVVSMLRESARIHHVNFDRVIREVLGIPARKLYRDWLRSLELHYRAQVDGLGTQVYGRKINKDGFDNYFPRFSPDSQKIFFLSSGKNDYSFKYRSLYSFALSDTADTNELIKKVPVAIKGYYDIDPATNRFVFSSTKSPKSTTPFNKGAERKRDLFLDNIPPDKKKPFAKKTENQITERKSLFMAAFSPDGSRLAAAHHHYDRFSLVLLDSSGENMTTVYPRNETQDQSIQTIYSIDWSPDGKTIAFSYVERSGDRKIGLLDTESREFSVLCDTPEDERDPRFSPDGKWLYFASDRTGIFNLYRLRLEDNQLQRITNVTGGAFAPDISPGGDKVVYVNYDKDGYAIYLLDSITVVDSMIVEQPYTPRKPYTLPKSQVAFSRPTPYSRLPRQFMLLPTVINEEVVSQDSDVSKGKRTLKAGAVINLWDPVAWAKRGNELGGYFLIEPTKVGQLLQSGIITNTAASYDLGAFYMNNLLPVDFSLEYNHRGITGSDFVYDYDGDKLHIDYSLVPRRLDFQLSKSMSDFSNLPLKLHTIASYNAFEVLIKADRYPGTIDYTPEKGARIGVFATMKEAKADQWSAINPRGLYTKLKWDRYRQRLQNSEEMFENDGISVNYDNYIFDQGSADIRFGMELPWKNNHTLYGQLDGRAIRLTDKSREDLRERGVDDRLPSFYEPGIWMPGYAYYYRQELKKENGNDSIADTLLISGNAVGHVALSYRFPLWPKLIDKKLGFIYFEHVLGAVNFNAGTGWNHLGDIASTTPSDFLKSVGAELRIEAVTFGIYPLAIAMRWDRGLDMPKNIGGDRFTLNLGFSFDNWEYIDIADYRSRLITRKFRGF